MKKILFASVLFLLPSLALAFSEDLVISSDSITFSNESFLEGRNVRIYATIDSKSPRDTRGVVKFYDNGSQISADQPISVLSQKEDSVFVDWIPLAGQHTLSVNFVLFDDVDDNPANNSAEKTVTVIADTDRDGTPNINDMDDDNDGVSDDADAFPLNKSESLDSDGDAKGNNADDDDDNDGVPDTLDALPLNTNEKDDTDRDGIGDNEDIDDDADGLSDLEEAKNGTDPMKKDTDGDSVDDKTDAYPLDSTKAYDYDRDGILDPDDPDADNDGIPKAEDVNDTNVGPIALLTEPGKKSGSPKRIGFPDELLEFDTQTSVDPDGQIQTVSFSIDDAKESDGPVLKKAFAKSGSYLITATLTDDRGESRKANFTVYIIPRFVPWTLAVLAIAATSLAIYATFSYSGLRRKK